MTLKAFLFLLVVTLVSVVGAALIAEALVRPGFERGIIIAVLAGLVVFPAARWAEYRGWIKGSWNPGGEFRQGPSERKEQEALTAAESGPSDARPDQQQAAAGRDTPDPRAGEKTNLGDSR